jgi:hypothetical protein
MSFLSCLSVIFFSAVLSTSVDRLNDYHYIHIMHCNIFILYQVHLTACILPSHKVKQILLLVLILLLEPIAGGPPAWELL